MFEEHYTELATAVDDVAEHIPLNILKEILAQLGNSLTKGGQIFVTYPPWKSPYASHVTHAVGIPWCQYLPDGITFSKALEIAGASDKMQVLDFSWDLNNRYTVWTGILGGTFLMLSYFGTDQSQVQRLFSAQDLGTVKKTLLSNGLMRFPITFIYCVCVSRAIN